MTRIRNPRDFWSGVLFLLLGSAAVLLSSRYPFGSTFKMGPGYFPTVLGALLALVGLVGMLRSVVRTGPVLDVFHWRKLLIILGGVLLFGLLMRGAGLLPAIILLVLVAALASQFSRWKSTLWLTLFLCAFCALVFVKLLGLPLSLFGPWLGG